MNIIETPLRDEIITGLKAGDKVFITGKIYTGRDAAHKRMYEAALNNEKPPFDYNGAIVYYAGPSPAKPGRVIGSIGPTTSGRMDKYSPLLMEHGLKAMIGKGHRSPEVIAAIKKQGGVYFAATGGAAALLAKCVQAARVVAYDDLGTEAVRELEVVNFPVIVAIDRNGVCVYD
jgi:fumarate hydratase subunit beta